MKLKHRLLAVAACAAVALCAPALAAPVTYSFSGQVDSDDAGRGWLSFSGSFTFSSTAIDGIVDPSTAAYAMAGAPYGMNVVFNDGTAEALDDSFNVLVSNNLGGWDWFGTLAQNAGGSKALGLTLIDFSGGVFASDGLPLPLGGLTLADFDSAQFVYEANAGILQGHLDAFTCTTGCAAMNPVPEPETYALMLAGLLAVGAQLRRCRRSADR